MTWDIKEVKTCIRFTQKLSLNLHLNIENIDALDTFLAFSLSAVI